MHWAMSFTVVYVALAIAVPIITLGVCMLGEKIGH
jgi:hypothetical protein